MKDFAGQELEVGDYIISSGGSKSSKTMYFGKVIRFGKKMVTIDIGKDSDPIHRYPGASFKLDTETIMMIKMRQ